MPLRERRNIVVLVTACVLLLALGGAFFNALRPVDASANAVSTVFTVVRGEGFRSIVGRLSSERLIRSPLAFETLALVMGSALSLQPGTYEFSPSMSSVAILGTLAGSLAEDVEVVIPEGADRYDIDRILSEHGIVPQGSFFAIASSSAAEGKLFPDTYRFFLHSNPADVLREMMDTFAAKAGPLLAGDVQAERDLILASIIQKEVPDSHDEQLVAGILLKRLARDMPLQVDATVCYAKEIKVMGTGNGCYPLDSLDFKIDSPYNTYLYRGLPPHPISNPGLEALRAAQNPLASSYWFYLSDPVTKKTIYSNTFDKHNAQRSLYLK